MLHVAAVRRASDPSGPESSGPCTFGAVSYTHLHNIQITRTLQPSKKRFVIHRIMGSGDLWITEYVLTYDGQPSYTVSIMEFRGVKVAHETQYFADPFEAGEWRKKWVANMDSPKDQGSSEGTFARLGG